MVSAAQTVYAAEALVTVQPITLGVYDAGSNFVGSSNHLTKEVFANITGGLIGSSGSPRTPSSMKILRFCALVLER